MQNALTFPFRSNLRWFVMSIAGLSAFIQLPLALRNDVPIIAALHLAVAVVFGFAIWASSRTPAGRLSDEEFVVFSPFGYAFWRVPVAQIDSWTFDGDAKQFCFTLQDGTEKRVGQGWIAESDLAQLVERLTVLAPGRVLG